MATAEPSSTVVILRSCGLVRCHGSRDCHPFKRPGPLPVAILKHSECCHRSMVLLRAKWAQVKDGGLVHLNRDLQSPAILEWLNIAWKWSIWGNISCLVMRKNQVLNRNVIATVTSIFTGGFVLHAKCAAEHFRRYTCSARWRYVSWSSCVLYIILI